MIIAGERFLYCSAFSSTFSLRIGLQRGEHGFFLAPQWNVRAQESLLLLPKLLSALYPSNIYHDLVLQRINSPQQDVMRTDTVSCAISSEPNEQKWPRALAALIILLCGRQYEHAVRFLQFMMPQNENAQLRILH